MNNKRTIFWNQRSNDNDTIDDLEVKPKVTDKVTTYLCNAAVKLFESLACYAVWAVLIHWIVVWIASR